MKSREPLTEQGTFNYLMLNTSISISLFKEKKSRFKDWQ